MMMMMMVYPNVEAVRMVNPFVIFSGRGGRNQHCPFHQAYLNEKDRLRPQYLAATTIKEKRYVQELLISWVTTQGGAFYHCNNNDDDKTYIEMTHSQQLKKVAQSLREPRKRPYKNPPSTTGTTTVPQIITITNRYEDANTDTGCDNMVVGVPDDTDSIQQLCDRGSSSSIDSCRHPISLTNDDDDDDDGTVNTFAISIDDRSWNEFFLEMEYDNRTDIY